METYKGKGTNGVSKTRMSHIHHQSIAVQTNVYTWVQARIDDFTTVESTHNYSHFNLIGIIILINSLVIYKMININL